MQHDILPAQRSSREAAVSKLVENSVKSGPGHSLQIFNRCSIKSLQNGGGQSHAVKLQALSLCKRFLMVFVGACWCIHVCLPILAEFSNFLERRSFIMPHCFFQWLLASLSFCSGLVMGRLLGTFESELLAVLVLDNQLKFRSKNSAVSKAVTAASIVGMAFIYTATAQSITAKSQTDAVSYKKVALTGCRVQHKRIAMCEWWSGHSKVEQNAYKMVAENIYIWCTYFWFWL